MNINAKIASRVKVLRNEKGYKMEVVAKELSMSKSAYSQLENGKTEITISKLQKIAEYFSLPIASIFEEHQEGSFIAVEIQNSLKNASMKNQQIDKELVRNVGKSIETLHKVTNLMQNKAAK